VHVSYLGCVSCIHIVVNLIFCILIFSQMGRLGARRLKWIVFFWASSWTLEDGGTFERLIFSIICVLTINVVFIRASPAVLNMQPSKNYFSHPNFVSYFFATPPIKLWKLGQQIGEGLLIANHLNQSLWWANQKQWAAVRSYLLHAFLQVHNIAVPCIPSHCKV